MQLIRLAAAIGHIREIRAVVRTGRMALAGDLLPDGGIPE
jgi:hypothetical protein